jgi:DNA-binding NtrC family response regulator
MILVVEDNPNARQLFGRMLRSAGYEVIESEDGEEALHLLDEHPLKLVITDLAMPKMTGFGLINQIRAKHPRLPIILVTGYLSPVAAEKILDDHIEFIPKPIDRNSLLSTVDRLLPHLHSPL